MSLKLGKPNMPPPEPRKDEEREMREAVVQDADKTEGNQPNPVASRRDRRWRLSAFQDPSWGEHHPTLRTHRA
jgi:hypothetical protein